MWSNKPVSDVEALQQAVQPFIQPFTIERHKIRNYNERGRVDDVVKCEKLYAFIKPSTKNINTQSDGMGRRVTASYSIIAVVPEYFEENDIIHHPIYGRLKVTSVSDNRYQGMMSGTLVRTGTTESSTSRANHLYEPD